MCNIFVVYDIKDEKVKIGTLIVSIDCVAALQAVKQKVASVGMSAGHSKGLNMLSSTTSQSLNTSTHVSQWLTMF